MIVVRVVVEVVLMVLVEVVRWGGTMECAAAAFIAIFVFFVVLGMACYGSLSSEHCYRCH